MDDFLPEVVCMQVKTVLAKALAVVGGDEEARILELFLAKALKELTQGLVRVADPRIVERPHDTTMLVRVIVVLLPHDLGSFFWGRMAEEHLLKARRCKVGQLVVVGIDQE